MNLLYELQRKARADGERNALTLSRMSRWQSAVALGWLPMHVLGCPCC